MVKKNAYFRMWLWPISGVFLAFTGWSWAVHKIK